MDMEWIHISVYSDFNIYTVTVSALTDFEITYHYSPYKDDNFCEQEKGQYLQGHLKGQGHRLHFCNVILGIIRENILTITGTMILLHVPIFYSIYLFSLGMEASTDFSTRVLGKFMIEYSVTR